ncbi:putative inactive 1-aminocyclopropane-1-carboxylate synthase-like protein 2 [Smittium culicis]|uniref:Putative inactive 1-aminocyclopropane-1-carboxylate synthase-like protein 2 n=1 Tax=Smittium culicis TaxID=133412 RepID=A0A1R1Y268_9FUNG|nr:putative inactive 1-aminocyclopropane-1-carboxylate synthase-like protein 2 [Smittium culicis]
MFKEELFSRTAKSNLQKDLSFANAIVEATNNVFDKDSNPNGVLNLGVAVNKLQEGVMIDKLNSINTITKRDLDYGDPIGSVELRNNIKFIINRHFKPHRIVTVNDIIVFNGITSGLDKLASALCNPGDAILIPSPLYSSFTLDFNLESNANVQLVKIPLIEFHDPGQVSYYKFVFKQLLEKGIITKLIVITNPNNPLGVCYSKPVLEEILKFANENSIFVLFDEIYALSVYRNQSYYNHSNSSDIKLNQFVSPVINELDKFEPFESILSWGNLDEFIDPKLIIVAHGLSKDFCLNGFRVGWFVSPWNKSLNDAISILSEFSFISGIADSITTRLLGDIDFIDGFIQTVQKNLLTSFERTTNYLNDKNVPFVPGIAGPFLWINIREQLFIWKNKNLKANEKRLESQSELTFDDEISMWNDILHNGRIYVTSGASYHSEEPGWIRLIFAIPWETMELGLDRLFEFITKSQ